METGEAVLVIVVCLILGAICWGRWSEGIVPRGHGGNNLRHSIKWLPWIVVFGFILCFGTIETFNLWPILNHVVAIMDGR